MDLEQFVSISLGQIIRGIAKAQEEAKDTNAWINPGGSGFPQHGPSVSTGGMYSPSVYIRDVEFDVAVTATHSKGGDAAAALRVWAIELGAKGRAVAEHSAASRIKFSIPVVWPWVARPKREEALRPARGDLEPDTM